MQHRHWHRSHRKSSYWLIIVIIILILGIGVYAYQNGNLSEIIGNVRGNGPQTPSYSSASIKSLSQNPTEYIGKPVVIRGVALGKLMDRIFDNDGYYLVLNGGQFGPCFDWNHRNYYDVLYKQMTLTAKGRLMPDGSTFECDVPLE